MDGDRMLNKLCRELHRKGIEVLLVNVGKDNLELMRKTGTLEEIGSQNIYRTVRGAVSGAQKVAAVPQPA
jgi:MFS superfamily sulfate permease-like transporter